MNKQFQAYSDKYLQLTPREQYLILLSGLAVIFLIVFYLFILLGLFVVLGQVPGFIRRTIPQYLSHMSLFFVPAIMAVWLFQDDVITHWLSLLLALVGTTILSMVVVMWLSHRLLKSS